MSTRNSVCCQAVSRLVLVAVGGAFAVGCGASGSDDDRAAVGSVNVTSAPGLGASSRSTGGTLRPTPGTQSAISPGGQVVDHAPQSERSSADITSAAKRAGVENAPISACSLVSESAASRALGVKVDVSRGRICGYITSALPGGKTGDIGVIAFKATARVRRDLKALTGPRPTRVYGPWEVAYVDHAEDGSEASATVAFIKAGTMVQIAMSKPLSHGTLTAIVVALGRGAAARL